jgi:hypothetical protein
MRRFRTLVSGLIGAVIVASSMIAFSAPVGASGGYPVPSNTTICKLLSFALQFVNTLPNSSFKTAVLSEIREELLAHGC